MARKNQPAQPSTPAANIGPARAINLLRDQLNEIDKLQQLHHKAPENNCWHQKTQSVLTLIFGDPSVELTRFKKIWFTPHQHYPGQPDYEFQQAYLRGLENAKSTLGAILFAYEQAHAASTEARSDDFIQDLPEPSRAERAELDPSQNSNYYFVAHEFSASGLDDLRSAIKEALSSSGLEPYFADKELIEGQIFINKILPKIHDCRFGIYDISNPAKPNVFIELGAAIASGARYYIVVREGVPVPSDLQGLDRIEYRSFEHLKSQLREKIKA